MVEFIRDMLQMWFYNRQTNAREMFTYLTTFADEHIKYRTETAHRCEIHPIHINSFRVDGKWKEITVDLVERSCSCRQWDLDELMCSHAMVVASIVMEEKEPAGKTKEVEDTIYWGEKKVTIVFKVWKKRTQ
ncbi:hypothetical protein Dsin_012626 [Dipteronia sinensis]|uniref:SWIM-type domain-containing protein n=1 Tax=Dipteronia sinensis TaxID=43782 RepID=A0AAE0AIL7_9ROSI|nr:hypothetical protein Dsin_012626 [Dipteronia sinensis]